MESAGESTRVAGESEEGEPTDVVEVHELEDEVKQMAEKLNKYRSTLPDQLNSNLTSILVSYRPILHLPDYESGSEPETSGGVHQGPSPGNFSAPDNDEKTPDDVELLRDKISSNISSMPNVLKRMNQSISRVDKLVSSNESIHPAFKRMKPRLVRKRN